MFTPFKKIINRPVNIALTGTGRIIRNHIIALAKNYKQARLVAICDIKEENLVICRKLIKEIFLEHKLPLPDFKEFTSYRSLLNSFESRENLIDLIVISTPSGLHPSQVIAAAKVGINVCTEKPMATRWKDGLEMVQECDAAGVRLFVVKQNRFNPTIQLLKEQIVSGRFGKLALITANVFWHRPQSYYDKDKWRGTWEFDGGALMNQASHYVDLLEWLVGPVQSVSASLGSLGRNIEVEDTAAVQLKWRNGALGTMSVTMLTYPENLEGSITILGDKGTVKIGGKAVNKIDHWDFADENPIDKEIQKYNNPEYKNEYGSGHTPFYKNVLDSLQGLDNPICDGREGLKSLELLIGAYRSAREARSIELPLEL